MPGPVSETSITALPFLRCARTVTAVAWIAFVPIGFCAAALAFLSLGIDLSKARV